MNAAKTRMLLGFLCSLPMCCQVGCHQTANGLSAPTKTQGVDAESTPADDATETTANSNAVSDDEPENSDAHGEGEPNRLAKETSPYLLQHAYNPVDWRPWGAEALAAAKAANKLIFLSVGYSSCHWCHVMERESFMDDEIAAILNEHFICIKVDREERPDVDDVYMTSLHIYNQLNGSGAGGGWPLSMFLTPEAKPFAGGTYFPSDQFHSALEQIAANWKAEPEKITRIGDLMAAAVRRTLEQPGPPASAELSATLLDDVQDELAAVFDKKHGGFGFSEFDPDRPKFPEPTNLVFLLQRMRSGDKAAEMMCLTTLRAMAAGGIRDHVGGGFHRYSVDRFWRVPHFEKMLYDNAQLLAVYAEAWQRSGDETLRTAAEETAAFMLSEMRSPEGGFYSALDADSALTPGEEKEEGRFYVYTAEELNEALNDAEHAAFLEIYTADGEPNFEGRYFIPLRSWLPAKQQMASLSAEQLAQAAEIKTALLKYRSQRPRPGLDSKILAAWNGLAVQGFAEAGRILENAEYTETAAACADFVLENLRDGKGRLLRTYSSGEAKLNAYLDDYAFVAAGLLALHRATGEQRWLSSAQEVMEKQDALFWDETRGGYYYTSIDHEELLARAKNGNDSVQPSGNTVAAQNLIYLAQATGDEQYAQRARKTLAAFAAKLEATPLVAPQMAAAVGELLAWEGEQ